MPSITFNSFFDDQARGNIVPAVDSFKCMLVNGYTPDKDAHTKRSHVTGEVTGAGYTAGGAAVTCTVSKDTANDRLDLTFSDPSWATSTITADGCVIYKARGGASSADELVAYVDFGGDVTSTGGTFATAFSSPLRIQN